MVKKIKPVSRTERIETEINRIAAQVFFQKRDFLGLDELWVPYVDISEKGDDIIVEVELPGIAQRDMNILLHSNRLEIRGVKREALLRERKKYLRLERVFGNFRRYIFLPCIVNPEKAKASLENGVLRIVLKKFERKKEKEIIVKIQKSKD